MRDVLKFLRSSGTVRMMRDHDPQVTEWALRRRWLAPRGEQRARRSAAPLSSPVSALSPSKVLYRLLTSRFLGPASPVSFSWIPVDFRPYDSPESVLCQ